MHFWKACCPHQRHYGMIINLNTLSVKDICRRTLLWMLDTQYPCSLWRKLERPSGRPHQKIQDCGKINIINISVYSKFFQYVPNLESEKWRTMDCTAVKCVVFRWEMAAMIDCCFDCRVLETNGCVLLFLVHCLWANVYCSNICYPQV